MRNSDPGVSVVSAQRPNSDFNSVFTIQTTGRNLQQGSNFRVLFESILLVAKLDRLGKESINDKPLNEIVYNHECPWSRNIVPLQQHA